MIAGILSILKIIGIVLICILGVLILLLFLVLFVPLRYQLKLKREMGSEESFHLLVKVTWLLHLLNVVYMYPSEVSLRVRIFCFTVFHSGKEKGSAKEPGKENSTTDKSNEKEETENKNAADSSKRKTETQKEVQSSKNTESDTEKPGLENKKTETGNTEYQKMSEKEEKQGLIKFFQKLIRIFKNIKYTICKICDKIKHIIGSIRYYIDILKSENFQNVWSICGGEIISLLKSIAPRKLEGNLTVGTGDPASTAQILAVYGMLYPFIGNHIFITPDFENPVFEGDFYMRGRITVLKALKTAIKVYFNKDLRKVIQLLKREAA